MRSAIILMLGGTGLEVGAMTRRMIVERYGHLRELPIITFLHLDTALEDASLTPAKVLGVDISLVSQERIRLEMPSFPDGGVSYLAQHPEIKEWFPSNLRIEHDFSLGAGAVRPYGRIAFAQNAAKIEQALHDCARRVNSNDVRTHVSQRWDPVENGIDVYIVCSLLGGTGGGTFLDAAYLARHVVSRYTPDVQILGYLVIGAGSSIKETPNLANCYSALKELNYYTTQAQIAKGNVNSPFSVEYPGMPFRVESGSVPPFDFCYLVTNFNEENVELQKPELFELTAQNIFLEFTPGVSSDKRAIRNNIVEHKFRELEQQLGQAQSYLTFGIATIEYPAARVQDCLAYRLAGETVSYLPFYTAPVDPSIPQEAKADLKRWVLDDEQLVASLITGGAGKRITTVIAEQKDQVSAQFQNYLGRPSRDELITMVKNFIETARNDVRTHVDPAVRGTHIRQIEQRGWELLLTAISELQRRTAEKISNSYGGLRNTRLYLDALENAIQSSAKSYTNNAELYTRKVLAANERVTKAFENLVRNKPDASDKEMGILVTSVLRASIEHSHNVVLEQANRYGHALLVGKTTLHGTVSECLLREVALLKAQVETYKTKLEEFGFDFVGTRERTEAGQEFWNGGKYRDIFTSLTTGNFISSGLVTHDELERLYFELIPNPIDQFLSLKAEVEKTLNREKGARTIFQFVLDQPDDVKRLLFELGRTRFRKVQETSIAEKLEKLPQKEVDHRIEEAFRRSHPLLRIDRSALFANDAKTGSRITGHNPGFHNIRKMATCRVQDDLYLDVNQMGENRSKLAVAFQTKVQGTEPSQGLPDRYRIVFTQEKGVFPLYCLADLPQLRKAYLFEMRQDNARPRETNRKVVFPDIFPPDPREVGMPRRVKKAVTLGRIFELIRNGKDVQTEEPVIEYAYEDEQFTLQVIQLGATLDEAMQKLAKRQLDKELYSQRPEEETNLEHLEGRLRRAGQKPVTVTQKSQGWERLQHHLVELAKTLPGGDRNPHYQEERDFINEFRAEHGWRPPEGWTAPTTTLVPAAVPAGPLAAPPSPSTTAVGDDTEAYRKRMRRRIERKRGASLTSDDVARMIRIAQEDYRLDPQTARQIIEAEQKGGGNQPNTQSIEKYREVCREVMEDGIVSDEDRDILADARQRYGLTSDQAAVVLAQEKYRDVCHEVIEDGVIPAEGRSVLDDARIRLQLSPEDAVNIESQVLFGQ